MEPGAGYSIQPETLRKAASELQAAGDELSSLWDNLVALVQGMGEPWGGDDIGMLIGTSYMSVQEAADDSYGGAAEDMAAMAESLTAMADNHEAAEQEMAADVSSISGMLNG